MTKKSTTESTKADAELARLDEIRTTRADVDDEISELVKGRAEATQTVGRLEAARRRGRTVDRAEEEQARRVLEESAGRVAILKATRAELDSELQEALQAAEEAAESELDAVRADYHAKVVAARADVRKWLMAGESRLRRLFALSSARQHYFDDGVREWADSVVVADPEAPREMLWGNGLFGNRRLSELDPDDLEGVRPMIEQLNRAEERHKDVGAEAGRYRGSSE